MGSGSEARKVVIPYGARVVRAVPHGHSIIRVIERHDYLLSAVIVGEVREKLDGLQIYVCRAVSEIRLLPLERRRLVGRVVESDVEGTRVGEKTVGVFESADAAPSVGGTVVQLRANGFGGRLGAVDEHGVVGSRV